MKNFRRLNEYEIIKICLIFKLKFRIKNQELLNNFATSKSNID